MKRSAILTVVLLMWGALPQARAAEAVAKADLIQPEDVAKVLRTRGDKPVILMVGFKVMYAQAHIPGAEYIGPGGEQRGITALRERAKTLPRKRSIILYCGCCPWVHCPNVDPAFKLLRDLGFRNVKVLYIASNFGEDWVKKGYPVEKD